MGKRRLIVFTRYPEPGKVKTRLISAMGEEGAADLHRRMTAETLRMARAFFPRSPQDIEICYTGGTQTQMEAWLGKDVSYAPQPEGNLGDRMAAAVARGFSTRSGRVVLIGTDCPQLTIAHLRQAFLSLKKNDMVIGPSEDGGYYLIGLRRWAPQVFTGISWGTPDVADQTLRQAQSAGLTSIRLKPLADVDRPQDLPVWEDASYQSLSIVIPALNEEKNISAAIASIGDVPDSEVIVVDGGSQDETANIARQLGAQVLISRPGRGGQLNLGADRARGDILLFLHADSRLPQEAARLIRTRMRDPRILGGYFHLRFEPDSPYLRFKQRKIAFRTRYFGLPYGDQAYFVRASVFRLLEGFPDIPLMEDVEFIRKLRRMGKVIFLPQAVTTSARRFLHHGSLRATLMNKVVFYAFKLGVSPRRLARWYYKDSQQAPWNHENDGHPG